MRFLKDAKAMQMLSPLNENLKPFQSPTINSILTGLPDRFFFQVDSWDTCTRLH
jgi:hypothetical protein